MAHGKRRQWSQAIALLRTMERRYLEEPSTTPAPNEFVYGATIGACAASAQWTEALALLEEMDARHIAANVRCYNGALSACDRADQPEAALQLFEKMRTGDDERIRPTTISYTSAISACARRPSMAERSPALLAQMRRDGLVPNTVTYGATAQAYATLGNWEAALQLLADMEAEGVHPNAVVISNVLNACAVGAAWRPALALLRGMASRYNVTPDVACTNAAIKACARGGQAGAALSLLDGLGACANSRSYAAVFVAYAGCSGCDEALRLLNRMRERGCPPTIECYTAALTACAGSASLERALALWDVVVAEPTLDALRRHRTLGEAEPPSFEAAIGACELWGLGAKLLQLLDSLAEEEARRLEALPAQMAIELQPARWRSDSLVGSQSEASGVTGGGADGSSGPPEAAAVLALDDEPQ